MVEYNRKEALRYLGARPNDKQAENLVDIAYLKLRNEVQPRHIIQKHSCTIDAEGITLDCGVRFTSSDLARHLKG